MTKRLRTFGALVAVVALAAACAAGKAFRLGEAASRAGDLDQAVAYYRQAAQAEPDNATYKIALQRASLAASRAHFDKARDFESKDQLEAAVSEYRLASEYDPTNRLAANKIAAIERTLRDRADAARPKPAIQEMRERARASSEPTLINFNQVLPLIRFNNASLRDVLTAIAGATGINVTYDRDVQDRPVSVQFDGMTLEQALNQLMTMNQLSYKIVSDRTIFVFQDVPPKHIQYDDQVVKTFYLSHTDVTDVTQLLSTLIRLPGLAVQPAIAFNKTNNTIVVRATTSVVGILEKVIQQIDKPRAEIVVDVEILEVDRSRAKTYGLDLSEYAIGTVLSPEVSPSSRTTTTGTGTPTTGTGTPTTGTPTTTGTGTTTTNTGTSTGPSQVVSPPPFNLNTISRGLTTADFYLAVPTAVMRALETDSRTKIVAKPQLRGAEGTKLTLNVGQRIPTISTSYTPIATGGAGVNPLSSYQYQDIGVNIEMTPRVTLDNDVILDLTVDDSQLGADKAIAGVTVPIFVQRKVSTRLRLRDGESNLLAGLMQESDQSSVTGLPGAVHVPGLKQLLSKNSTQNDQVEIVMMLTPHIIRSQEITEQDLKAIYIGSQQNLGVGGAPPLITPPQGPEAAAAAPAPGPGQPGYVQTGPGGVAVAVPPGSTPVPGTVLAPTPAPPAAPAPPPAAPTPPVEAAPPPAVQPPAAPTPPQPETTTSPGMGVAQVVITPPGTTFRVGGGPYTVPISVVNATRLSTITLTISFDPALLRVRAVQEGSFMKTGGVITTFAQSVNAGRVDVTISRASDATGAVGTGLLAALQIDPVSAGTATLTVSGSATGPGGTPMGLQFRPVTITVQQ